MSPSRVGLTFAAAAVWLLVTRGFSQTTDATIVGGAGPAIAQPFGTVVLQPCPSALGRGGDSFVQTADVDPRDLTLWICSEDQLLHLDPLSGVFTSLGRFERGQGFQWTLYEDSTENVEWVDWSIAHNQAEQYTLTLSGEVSLFDADGVEPLVSFALHLGGLVISPLQDQTLLDQEYHYPADGSVEQSVRLVVSLESDGLIEIEFVDFAGDGRAELRGDMVVEADGTDEGRSLVRSMTGVARTPDGKTWTLSDAGTEPGGLPVIYSVESVPTETGPVVEMTPVVTVQENPPRSLWAMEVAADGSCYLAGEDIYLLDVSTGELQWIASPEIGPIIDMDIDANGTLRAITHGDAGETILHEIDLVGGTVAPVLTLPGETLWGMAVLPRAVGDLNADGAVNDADLAIYAEQYTGSLSGPWVPPGPGTSWLGDTIVVPYAADVAFPSLEGGDMTRFEVNGVDGLPPGIVVEGPTRTREQSHAWAHFVHDDENVYVAIEVFDDQVDENYDYAEIYLDANNSDLPEREGDVNGFLAWFTHDEHSPPNIHTGGEALTAWDADEVHSLFTFGGQFQISKAETGMATGGTYGFDLAIKDSTPVDGEDPVTTHYFLFSTTSEGGVGEGQWGNIRLAEGPLAPRVIAASPGNFSVDVPTTVGLSWQGNPEATTYRVFIGGSAEELIYQGDVAESSFLISELTAGATYFWRVDSVNGNGTRTGMVWRFMTAHLEADVDHDGDVDELDLAIIESNSNADSDGDGIPNCADNCAGLPNADQADCDSDGLGDVCAISNGFSEDCNRNAVPDECDIASGTSTDCSFNGIPDECDIAEGTEPDCNNNGIADACDLLEATSMDCNANKIPDECDLATGLEQDCNNNDVPDVCDLASMSSDDCNQNLIPDECDLADGSTYDCQPNGVPDECELNGSAAAGWFELEHTDMEDYDYFGTSVAIRNEVAVCGAYGDDIDELSVAGSAYVFRRNSADGLWQQEAKLTAPNPGSSAYFGEAVATDGQVVVVGAHNDAGSGVNAGAVYVFKYDGEELAWELDAQLLPADPNANDYFGTAVAIQGDEIWIGAETDDAAGSDAGAVYRFEHDGTSWVQVEKIVAKDAGILDHFGVSIRLDGDMAVVGADLDDDVAGNAGAVYYFKFNGEHWIQSDKLTPTFDTSSLFFGRDLDLKNNTLLVGAFGSGPGAAYMFRFDPLLGKWEYETELVPVGETSEFGRAVVLEGTRAYVGAVRDDSAGTDAGALFAYVYNEKTGEWTFESKLTSPNAESNGYLGWSLAAHNSRLVVGAYEESGYSGRAYVLPIYGLDCDGNGVPDNCQYDMDADGIPDSCDEDACPGDANGDGIVDALDIGFVLARFGCDIHVGDRDCTAADQNFDGAVDPLDSGYVLSRFNTCE